MPDAVFKVEDKGNGYRFVTAPEYPGFNVMLRPGDLWPDDQHSGTLATFASLDSAAAERERCAQVAEQWLRSGYILLHGGEMTAQELRSVKAVIRAVIAEIRNP